MICSKNQTKNNKPLHFLAIDYYKKVTKAFTIFGSESAFLRKSKLFRFAKNAIFLQSYETKVYAIKKKNFDKYL